MLQGLGEEYLETIAELHHRCKNETISRFENTTFLIKREDDLRAAKETLERDLDGQFEVFQQINNVKKVCW